MTTDAAPAAGTETPPDSGAHGTESGQQASNTQTGSTPPAASQPDDALTVAQAEAANWRSRYRDLQGKFETAVGDARKSADETLDTMRDRLVRAEVRAIAAGRLADPADAVQFLDTAAFLNAKGEIDDTAIGKAIDDLLVRKPYLATQHEQTGNGHGSADQGARGGRAPATPGDQMNAIIRGGAPKR